ncbi:unnamed protein product [Trichogramma brassicae]|uniref:Uncharacterized protein n=1 Tax=Trichogramma brassicae TaxID=86971 RepID=A0A6H5J1W3_9HYME|nr:unnamed protein product [Trichogramma brassicae]
MDDGRAIFMPRSTKHTALVAPDHERRSHERISEQTDNIECQHDFGTSVPSRGAVRGPSTCGHDSNIVSASTPCRQSASMNVRAPITTTAWCHTAVTT